MTDDKPMTPSEMGKKSHEARMEKYGTSLYSENGKKSHLVRIARDPEAYRKMGLKSAAAKRAKKEAALKEKSPLSTLSRFLKGQY